MVWAIPALTIILLGGVAWIGAHQLDPAAPVDGSGKPLRIQAVSLDWKWLFIYPDQNVAAINTLTVPAGVPLHFELTSASVMNAFFIPQFGSMIYTMNGMTTRLNLRADHPGTFARPFGAFQRRRLFGHALRGSRRAACAIRDWADGAAQAPQALDEASYREIAKPSTHNAPALYRLTDPDLFNAVATQKLPPAPGAQSGVKGAALPAGVADAR